MCQRLRVRSGEESVNRLNRALEVAGGLELLLVDCSLDLKTIEPGHNLVGGPLCPVFGCTMKSM